MLKKSARLWRHEERWFWVVYCYCLDYSHAARNTFKLWPSTFDCKPADSAEGKMAAEYERVSLVKPEVFIYQIPPRSTNRAIRWEARQKKYLIDTIYVFSRLDPRPFTEFTWSAKYHVHLSICDQVWYLDPWCLDLISFLWFFTLTS